MDNDGWLYHLSPVGRRFRGASRHG